MKKIIFIGVSSLAFSLYFLAPTTAQTTSSGAGGPNALGPSTIPTPEFSIEAPDQQAGTSGSLGNTPSFSGTRNFLSSPSVGGGTQSKRDNSDVTAFGKRPSPLEAYEIGSKSGTLGTLNPEVIPLDPGGTVPADPLDTPSDISK